MVSTEEETIKFKWKGFDYYSVFSLWDTFRAASIVYFNEKKRTADFINTFLSNTNKAVDCLFGN
jgi:putative alpha-1,2-mannosidase